MKNLFKLLLAVPFLMLSFTLPQKKVKVLFFGDSITQASVQPGGYITRMDSIIRKSGPSNQVELIGAGIGGNKVYDLYLRMEEDVLKKQPDIVVIYIGINDVWHKTGAGTGTDLDKYEKFYRAIIQKLQSQQIKVVLCTPTVIGEKADGSNQQDGDLNQYSKVIRNIAANLSLPVIDLRAAFLDHLKTANPKNEEKGILTSDRVHLNDSGNLFLANEMWKVLKGLI